MDAMDTMNSMIESILNDTGLAGLIINTEWTTQNFPPTTVSSLENTLDTNYAFPPAQMAFSWSSDGSPTNTMYDTAGIFPESISPEAKYPSLDGDQQNPGYLLQHEGCGSFSADAKETAKEVSHSLRHASLAIDNLTSPLSRNMQKTPLLLYLDVY